MEERGFVVEKEFEHCGFKCVVVLQDMGHRCGYVGVTSDHLLYGVDYDEDEAEMIDCHGGLTYANGGAGSKYPIESNLWWFGFDCAHFMDAYDYDAVVKAFPEKKEHYEYYKSKGLMFREGDGTVRTLEYVESECKKIAEQLAEWK